MTYFMLFISVMYLLAEVAFRAFAIDRMGSLNLLQSEIQYLEIVGRILAAFGFSLFFVNLSKTTIILKKLGFFSIYFIVFFFTQKMIFDNIHHLADKDLKENAYNLNIYKNVVFTDDKLSSDLPYSYKGRESVKFKTFFGLMPYLYSSSDLIEDYIVKNEDYFLREIVNFKMDGNIEMQVESFNNLRDSTVAPLYKIRKNYLQFQPNSELHKQFIKFHFGAFGYYFLQTKKELFPDYSNYSMLEAGYKAFQTGIPEKLYIDLSLKSRRKVQGYLYTKIKQMSRNGKIDLSDLPGGQYAHEDTFFPNEYDYFYHNFSENHVIKYMRKRYNYEEELEEAVNQYARNIFNKEDVSKEEYNAIFEIIETGDFSLFYKNSLIVSALKENEDFVYNHDLIKLIFSKDYDSVYISEENYVNNFLSFFKAQRLEKIKSLKSNTEDSVKAVIIPPVVILFSTIAVFLNFISIVSGLFKKFNVSKKKSLPIISVLILFFVIYPFHSNVESEREKSYYKTTVPILEVPDYKVLLTRWLTNTNQILSGKFGSYEELVSLFLSGMQLRYEIYIKEGDFEYIMLQNNVREQVEYIKEKYPDSGVTITNYLT